jgi:hypothetical protein
VSSLVRFGPVVLQKIFNWPHPIFHIFVIISPLKRTWPFIWTNLDSLHPRIICIKFDWIWPAGSGEEDFFFIQCIFTLLLSPPLREGLSPSFEQTWIPSPQGWFVPSLVKIGQVVLKKFFKWPQSFSYFCDYLPFEEDLALYLNKFEFLSAKDNLYQVWSNMACWISRRFLKNFNVFLFFHYYLPLEKGYPLHLNKLESPPPQGWFVLSLVKIGPVVPEKKSKM